MINVDSKNGVYEFEGNMIDVITDIGFAIFNVAVGIATVSGSSWNKAFKQLMNSLTKSVKSAYKDAQKYYDGYENGGAYDK